MSNVGLGEIDLKATLGIANQDKGYDAAFISYAIKCLTESQNLESALDVLLEEAGHKFHLDNVILSEFIGNGLAKVTNRWTSDENGFDGQNEITNIDDWDGFLGGFDETGVLFVPDVSQSDFSKRDMAFFEKYNIQSFLNVLLYGNEKPIAYITYNKHIKGDNRHADDVRTLLYLSNVLATYVNHRIAKRNDRSKIEELSVDELTGLYNYAAFQRKVRKRLKNREKHKVYAIVAMDISYFSSLNENFGYEEGDRVLRDMARMLKANIEYAQVVCRSTADRFLMLEVADSKEKIEENLVQASDRFTKYLKRQYPLIGLRTTSGIRYVEEEAESIRRLIDEANHARKSIKHSFTDYYSVFTAEMHARRESILHIVGSVQAAIDGGYIEAFLQPKFSISQQSVIGAEALVRWKNPDGTYKFPDEFIPVLEDSGLIVDLDLCVYKQVLQLLNRWKKEGRKLIPISVNLSRVDFEVTDFSRIIIEMAEKYGISPKYIEIEVTESCLSSNVNNMYRQLDEFRQAGFKVDMDDFGTGQSSLNMLMSAPVDVIKVDKSFLNHSHTEQEKEYIRQICNLINIANKEGIFEGVETEEQLSLLSNCGCDAAQGYYYSKPITIQQFENKFI